jgi:hypothetical protein
MTESYSLSLHKKSLAFYWKTSKQLLPLTAFTCLLFPALADAEAAGDAKVLSDQSEPARQASVMPMSPYGKAKKPLVIAEKIQDARIAKPSVVTSTPAATPAVAVTPVAVATPMAAAPAAATPTVAAPTAATPMAAAPAVAVTPMAAAPAAATPMAALPAVEAAPAVAVAPAAEAPAQSVPSILLESPHTLIGRAESAIPSMTETHRVVATPAAKKVVAKPQSHLHNKTVKLVQKAGKAAKVAAKAPMLQPVSPPTVASPSWFNQQEGILVLAGFAALAFGFGGAWCYRNRRNILAAIDLPFPWRQSYELNESMQDESESDAVVLAENASIATVINENVIDVLEQAEIYASYGRTEKVIHVMQMAFTADPSRTDVAIKLLMTYKEIDNKSAYTTLYDQLAKRFDTMPSDMIQKINLVNRLAFASGKPNTGMPNKGEFSLDVATAKQQKDTDQAVKSHSDLEFEEM